MRSIRSVVALIILVAIGLGVYFVMTNRAAPEFVEVSKISVGNMKLSPSPSFDLSAELEFNNPNSFGLTIKKVQCDIIIEGDKVTNIAYSKDIEVPANAHFAIPLETNIKLNEESFKRLFGANLFESLLSNELKMKFQGDMTLSKFGISRTIPFTYDYTYKIL